MNLVGGKETGKQLEIDSKRQNCCAVELTDEGER
jgi:hypothetical protein